MMDETLYIRKQEAVSAEYEARCKRCGSCCGAGGQDPCANLAREKSGLYYCKNYEARMGIQHTVSGRTFSCIPIREVRKFGIPFEDCGYNSV